MFFAGYFNGFLVVLFGVGIAVAVVWLIQRLIPQKTLVESRETTGAVLAVAGTLYAVMLGLVVVDAMVRFERSIDVTQTESTALADIHIMAGRIPEPHKSRVRHACRDYAATVVEKEWPLLAAKGEPSLDARQAGLRVLRSLDGFEPVSESEKAIYPIIIDSMQTAWDHRRQRIATARYGVPGIEWVTLLLGAVVTIVLCGLFPFGDLRFHLLLTSMAAILIVLNLYLVSLFGYPYAGDLRVSEDPFRVDIGIFQSDEDAFTEDVGQTQSSADR